MVWERVYTVNEFWDCARLGVADVFGVPNIYQSPFDQVLDDYSDFYLVSPIDQELLGLVLEDWEIWKRWSSAFDTRTVSIDTHPALPEDRLRHELLKSQIGERLVVDRVNCERYHATFRQIAPGWDGLKVNWTRFAGDDE